MKIVPFKCKACKGAAAATVLGFICTCNGLFTTHDIQSTEVAAVAIRAPEQRHIELSSIARQVQERPVAALTTTLQIAGAARAGSSAWGYLTTSNG